MSEVPKKETLTVEFKSDRKRLKDSILVEAVVGMSNSSGGDIYLGVEDDGTVTGLHSMHKDPMSLAAMIANKTIPSVNAQTEMMMVNGVDVMDISVPSSKYIVSTSEGKVLKRRIKQDGTPENFPMYPFEISSRLSAMGSLDFSEEIVNQALLTDFSSEKRDNLRSTVKQFHGDMVLLELDDEEFDQALGLVKEVNGEKVPTAAGLLMIGKTESIQKFLPGANASFQVVLNGDVRVNKDLYGTIPELIEALEMNLQAWNPEQETYIGYHRLPVPTFGNQACREAIVNALCHRDYSALGNIRVLVDDMGLTISNPGGFVDGVTIDNLLTVTPKARNTLLSYILKRVGLAEKTGRGIDKIYAGSWRYGRAEPDYSESSLNEVVLFIPRSRADFPLIQFIETKASKGMAPSQPGLKIINLLNDKNEWSLKNVLQASVFSEARTKAVLDELEDKGYLLKTENGYLLNENVLNENVSDSDTAKSVDKENAMTQEGPLSDDEKVLKILKENGTLQRKDVMEALNVNAGKANRILKAMTEQGKLTLIKRGNRSYYILND